MVWETLPIALFSVESEDVERNRTAVFSRPQFYHRRAAAALVLRRLTHAGHMRMALQELAQCLAQNAHATSMHYAEAHSTRKKCAVHELLHRVGGLVHRLADYVDLGGRTVVFARERNVDAAGPGRSYGIGAGARDHLGKIVTRDLHLHGADGHLETVIIEVAQHLRVASQRLQAYGIADGNVLNHMLLGVRIARVGTGSVRYDGGIELFAKFTAQLGDAALGVLRKLECLCAVLHRADRLARAVLEIAQQAFQLLLHLAHFVALFLTPLGGEMVALASHFLLAALQCSPFAVNLTQFGVK